MRIRRINKIEEVKENDDFGVDLTLLNDLISLNKGKRGNVIPLLQGIQHLYGFLPRVVIEKVAVELNLNISDLYGVATFYSQFRMKPVGKHIIKVCHGTACHVQNANVITNTLMDFLGVKDGETTPDGLFTLETVACLGCCSLAPVIMIGDDTFGKLTAKSVVKILTYIKNAEKN